MTRQIKRSKLIQKRVAAIAALLWLTCCRPIVATVNPGAALPTPINYPAQSGTGLFLPDAELTSQVRFTRLNQEDGLSQSVINCLVQDRQGFIWVGTQDGLNRYDGYSFKIYRPDPADPASIGDRWINALFQDSSGYIWIGTRQAGVDRYDPRTDSFTHYLHDGNDVNSLVSNNVQVITEDQSGQIWIGTTGGLDRYSPEQNNFIHHPLNAPSTFVGESDSITEVYEDSAGHLWIGTAYTGLRRYDNITAMFADSRGNFWIGTANAGLRRYDGSLGTYTSFLNSPSDPTTLSSNTIRAIKEDTSGALWIATDRGLDYFDPATGRVQRYQHSAEDPGSLSSDFIRTLLIDKTGGLWVGTNASLDRFQPSTQSFLHYRNEASQESSLSSNIVTTIFESQDSVIWVGTYGGGLNKYYRGQDRFTYYSHLSGGMSGLSGNVVYKIHVDPGGQVWVATLDGGVDRLDPESGQIISYQNDPQDPGSLGSNEVWSVYTDANGTLWVGTAYGLDRLDAGQSAFIHYQHNSADMFSLAGAPVYDILEDRHGTLWVGTEYGLERYNPQWHGFQHYRPDSRYPDSLSGSEVVTLFLDHTGSLWVGTFNDGLNRYLPETDSFERYQHDPQDPASLSNNSVLAVYEDHAGSLWIGTFGGGLNRYNRGSRTFTHYLESDGLPSNVVSGIQEDKNGMLWLSTNNGLSRFDPQAGTFRNFTVSDGLQGNEFNLNAAAQDEDGRLYFGGVNGLTLFDPTRILESTYPPPVVLLSITQDGIPLNRGVTTEHLTEVTLRWPDNNFEFSFAGLSYVEPDRNQYAYRLENLESSWNYVGTERSGRYTNLPGGTYTLRIAASNQDGVWNETGLAVRVKVVPPFWQNWVYQVSAGIGVLGLGMAVYWMRMRNIRMYNRQLEQEVRDRTREIERLFEKTKELAVVEERNRLARELHDSAKQKAFAALAQLGTANGLFRNDPSGAQRHIGEAENLVYEVIEELTFLIQEMYPLALKEKGLAITLRDYVFDWENRTDIQADINIQDERPLPLVVEQAIFRVVQEALSNVARHSQAAHVEVMLSYNPEAIEVFISDDGCGFVIDSRQAGMGLRSIRERIESLDGTVSIESLPECGTRLTARVPLEQEQGTGKGDRNA